MVISQCWLKVQKSVHSVLLKTEQVKTSETGKTELTKDEQKLRLGRD